MPASLNLIIGQRSGKVINAEIGKGVWIVFAIDEGIYDAHATNTVQLRDDILDFDIHQG